MSLGNTISGKAAYRLLHPYIPDDHAAQMTAQSMAGGLLKSQSSPTTFLDLGCGSGHSRNYFDGLGHGIDWFGVDIKDSPETLNRIGNTDRIVTYDGTRLPFKTGTFDIVYSSQVLEHVRHPDLLLNDVARILRPGGYFVGSVSYLEPYHSYSIFNFTPYGISEVLRDAGLQLVELRPGVDGMSLIMRQMLNGPKCLDFIFRSSPFNKLIGLVGVLVRLEARQVNFLKLSFAGHICFIATR